MSDDPNATFAKQLAQLYMSEHLSDVTLIVDNERLPAHKLILAARSEYFRERLYGELASTSGNAIECTTGPVEHFKIVLKYAYTGEFSLPAEMDNENDLLKMLIITNVYKFDDLSYKLSDSMEKHFTMANIEQMFEAFKVAEMNELPEIFLRFMDEHAEELLEQPIFLNFSKDVLVQILSRDSFVAPEINIFESVKKWHEAHKDVDITELAATVRLELLTIEQLMENVRPAGIMEADKLLTAIEKRRNTNDLPYRYWPDRNIATAELKTFIYLRNGSLTPIDLKKNILFHQMTDCKSFGIVIRLGKLFPINHIKLRLADNDQRFFGYIIEISCDNSCWECVIDYSFAHCTSMQRLYFKKSLVRYIRFTGINTDHLDRRFIITELSVMCTTEMPRLCGDIIIAEKNVATLELGAVAITKNCCTKTDIFNGDFVSYNGDYDFSLVNGNGGYVLIRLAQPYLIGSMRLLLWDRDQRSYGYYVETSLDNQRWEIVADKRQELSSSWQILNFPALPMIYIRIICTRICAPDAKFLCVHFECPSQIEDLH